MTPPTYQYRPTMCQKARRLLGAFCHAQTAHAVAVQLPAYEWESVPQEITAAWEAYRDHRIGCAECAKIAADIVAPILAEIAAEGQGQP